METIDAICHSLGDPKIDRVNFLVGTGMSGSLILVPTSVQSGIPCGVVRKQYDKWNCPDDGGSHSCRDLETVFEGEIPVLRYVILDDVMETGRTVDRIIDVMRKEHPGSKCVGIILYQTIYSGQHGDGIPIIPVYNDISELKKMELV